MSHNAMTQNCRPGGAGATGRYRTFLLFRFGTEPFFVDFVVCAVLFQRFQRAVHFLTQFIAAFREGDTVLLGFQGFAYCFELTVASGFTSLLFALTITNRPLL